MATIFDNPLDELDEQALFKLLGDAWLAQFKPVCGEAYELKSAVDVGKDEFESLVPALRIDLLRPDQNGTISCVRGTIARNSAWAMPPNVLAAIAVSRGLVPNLRA